jgi:hypothetical protein
MFQKLSVLTLATLLTMSPVLWALPELDVRSNAFGAVTVAGLPSAPTALITTSYTCPALGRLHVLVTGRLSQVSVNHFESWSTRLSISRNSVGHASTSRFYDAPGAFGSVSASDEQDIALQSIATCEAGQLVTYRLMGNKAEAAQPSPILNDATLVLTYIASTSANGG